jgi:protein PhnA
VGEGGRDAKHRGRVRGLSADADPSSGADFIRATFSRKGRREEGAPLFQIKGITTMDIKVRDSNGALLAEGDSVTLIKDLKLKGSSTVLKRGTVIRGIHLTDNADEIEGRTDKVKGLVLRTEFLKKA